MVNDRSIIKSLRIKIQRKILRGLKYGRKKPRNSKAKVIISKNSFNFLKNYGLLGNAYIKYPSLIKLLDLHLNIKMTNDLECECTEIKFLIRKLTAAKYILMNGEDIKLPREYRLFVKSKRIEHVLNKDGQRRY
ncbi:unnamed protein product [Didymodactylos carnosus]|uniref:Uncharacterized protein n=1 Tax=Didymodactylos carnosus TaxID=1234261 RepID=A0A8S2D708_9BILA|nr:unnamed protein product [Didymodactylos carnosus]CAF3638194.1 unnamed protein product [Didymodactylos carnosus]CAF4474234.1 unnamed protein product [Didymodactylos carnosus]